MIVERVWPKTVKEPKTGKRTEYRVTTTFRKAGHGVPRLGDWVGSDCPMAYQPQVHTRTSYDLWEKVNESAEPAPESDA